MSTLMCCCTAVLLLLLLLLLLCELCELGQKFAAARLSPAR